MVQVKEGPELRALAKEMRTHNTVLPAERGNIYTEDGLLLCSSIPQFNLHVDFSVIKQDTFYRYVDSLAGCLSGLFKDGSKASYREILHPKEKSPLLSIPGGTYVPDIQQRQKSRRSYLRLQDQAHKSLRDACLPYHRPLP